jgi:hypothetical protein
MSFLKKLLGLEKPTEDKSTGVLLTTAHGNEELAAIVALLRAADIPFRTAEQGAGDVVRVIAGYNMYGTAIYVHEEHLETARELLTPVDAENTDAEQTEGETDQ